jgi:hypothetical protein
MKCTEPEKSFKDLSPFYIQQTLDCISGSVKNAFRLKDGIFYLKLSLMDSQ